MVVALRSAGGYGLGSLSFSRRWRGGWWFEPLLYIIRRKTLIKLTYLDSDTAYYRIGLVEYCWWTSVCGLNIDRIIV